ncbi:hypothetical protein [Spirosoma telluris]|uniref:hypothetical protein n=1 Tax=Spirosoma telluris TaxID=2183553 RepID=UPI002FC34AB6
MNNRLLLLLCCLLPTIPVLAQNDIIIVSPTGNTSRNSVFIGVGVGSGSANTGSNNVFSGVLAGYSNTYGWANVFNGYGQDKPIRLAMRIYLLANRLVIRTPLVALTCSVVLMPVIIIQPDL